LQTPLRYDTLAWIQGDFLESEISGEKKRFCDNYLGTTTPETLYTDFVFID